MVEHATTIWLAAITVAAFLVTMAHGVKQREIHVQNQVWSTAMAMAFAAESSIMEMMVTFFHIATVLVTMIQAQSADISDTTMSVGLNLSHVVMECVTTLRQVGGTLVNALHVMTMYILVLNCMNTLIM